MLFAKNIIIFSILLGTVILQTGCTLNSFKKQTAPCDDFSNYTNMQKNVSANELPTEKVHSSSVENGSDACLKLRQAVNLSVPNGKQQCDKKALLLLKDLKHSGALADEDLRFNNMLLQQVSERQNLHEMISVQELRLKKTEAQNVVLQKKIKNFQPQLKQLKKIETQNTVLRNHLEILQSQLDQLKNIEIEIDKKERSVISPIEE